MNQSESTITLKTATSGFGACPIPISRHETVQLGHGSGGLMSRELVEGLFVHAFDNPILSDLNDAGVIDVAGSRLAVSTDSFVVDPLFFPGGDIGDLAVNGTVNDLAVTGARPLFLSLGLILEEGFSIDELARIVESIRKAAKAAGVVIATGDTKVVNRGKGDKVFINTSGIGLIERDHCPSVRLLRPGDVILLSGPIAEHGMTILSRREGLRFETEMRSDTAPLNGLVDAIQDAGGRDVHAMRDPTRGGVAATLNEFAAASDLGIQLIEETIPVRPAVAGACEFLGIDPLYVANEGKVVVAVSQEASEAVLEAMHAHEYGKGATKIGHVVDGPAGMVTMRTAIGGERIVDMAVGEQLPRIC